jgi:hypothetical protein
MQSSLAIEGGIFGPVAYFGALDWRWLLGPLVLLANWPYTIFVIMTMNKRLMDTSPAAATRKRAACSSGGVLFMPVKVLLAS